MVTLLGFHINPYRSDISIGYTGGAIGLFVWLVRHKKRLGFKAAFFGYLGFGLGMSLGRLLANLFYLQPFTINQWNIMEVMCGFIGGGIFTWGMLGVSLPDRPRRPLIDTCAIVYVVALIPLFHRLLRLPRYFDGVGDNDWSLRLAKYGYENPEELGQLILMLINGLCVAGFIVAALWMFAHFTRRSRWSPTPVLGLSLTMLLIQNLHVLFLLYPHVTGSIDMHFVYWVMIGLMMLYATAWNNAPFTIDPELAERVRWKRWTLVGVGVFLLMIVLAEWINGEQTMQSACTRFPIWSWRDGPR